MKTDEELKQIAKDVNDGKVFLDVFVPDELITSIFFGLNFIENREKIKDVVCFYEYYEKASKLKVDSPFPLFGSFQTLTIDEANKLSEYGKADIIERGNKNV